MLLDASTYAGVLGAFGGAFVDAHRNKGEVAALEKRAKEASEASQQRDLHRRVRRDPAVGHAIALLCGACFSMTHGA